ncbi:MAG: hypothetical protein ACM3MK_08670 [Chitinophagales bacterium]
MQLTLEQAYRAMVVFLEGFYERTGSDDVGGLLGGMIILDDGETADPAAWNDWIDSVSKVKGD